MALHRMIPLAFALGLMAAATPSRADPALDALARDVGRSEDLRAVKTLQRRYAHYAQFGQWREMGALFAGDARFIFDGQVTAGETVQGPAAIAAFLRTRYGDGHDGLQPGDVRTMMIEAPLINLSPDGQSAKGRWYALIFTGGKGAASIEGGTFENDYVRTDGVWKIATAHYYPQFAGPYETGWTNWGGGDLPIVPYHFTPDTAGTPIPPATGAAPATNATLAQLQQRIGALNVEDQVRNLQSAYGYYLDRKMWDDVVDLFAKDGSVEIGGAGRYQGTQGIRRWLETMGPAGLKHGQLHDHPQFDTIVTVAPGGNEAWARGVELGMLGEADAEKAWWSVGVFTTRFVREAGVWKIREMRHDPLFRSDYDLGWGKSNLVAHPVRVAPAFPKPQPATGRLTAAPVISLDEARRRLAMSQAYDGIENVSSAYTVYLDDYQSHQFGALIAEKGFKMSAFAGYYVGRDRVTEAGVRVWGKPPITRPGVHFHWRVQPVILVSQDGRSADMRVRLFQPRTGKEVGGPGAWYGANFMTGMYHDQFVLEHGIWRMFNLSLDEPYAGTVDWKSGWARAKDPKEPPQGPASALLRDGTFLPDIPVKDLGKRQEHFRGGTGNPLQWPSILPMWFEYTNPVSGRVPEHYQADCPPCTVRPSLRLDRNGYQQPQGFPEANRAP